MGCFSGVWMLPLIRVVLAEGSRIDEVTMIMIIKKIAPFIFALAMLLSASLACAGFSNPTGPPSITRAAPSPLPTLVPDLPLPQASPTTPAATQVVQPTPTKLAATAEVTAAPSATVAITAQPSSTAAVAPTLAATPYAGGVMQINFPVGKTSAVLTGDLTAFANHDYRLWAAQNQTMVVELFSTANDVYLEIVGEDGRDFVNREAFETRWQGDLPVSQQYYLRVNASGVDTRYTLVITIPRVVEFPRGSYGTIETGSVKPGEAIAYRLWAAKGQTMSLSFNSAGVKPLIGVYVLEDGSPLVRPESGLSAWSGVLPEDGQYVVQVYGPAQEGVDYTLLFDIR